MCRPRQYHRSVPAARKTRRPKRGPQRTRPYASIPRWAVRALRAATHAACGRRCVYCADRLCIETATLDHVVPRRLGGPTTADNVVVACYACNLLKGGRAPFDFFRTHPWAADNFLRYATRVAHAHKHDARAAMSQAYAIAA